MPISISTPKLKDDPRKVFAELGFVTASDHLITVLRQATRAATVSDVTILIDGETGTGKQILARAIHHLDAKRGQFPFVTAHCSTISESIAESELFGHRRGAFTGAVADRPGLFQAAHRGTLFLDDVNDLPMVVQPKLLDVIQRGVMRPIGSDKESSVDVRIVAASNKPLGPLVAENRFRSDLYHRLNVISLKLPPLRERPQDLESLILAFAIRYRHIYEPIVEVRSDLLRFLQMQPFPGNVRELENSVLRMLFEKRCGSALEMGDWAAQSSDAASSSPEHSLGQAGEKLWQAISTHKLPFTEAISQLERQILQIALRDGGSTRKDIANCLQTSERTLYHKIRAHHLSDRPRA
ncbi:sigma 54-interacting transcriptional regulator [Telmatobacter sp. DSM 110680]|uniref:Sigma 54-interacting transcriptional regulator n=1 Tax=Telmatobacter sp. DSM 110680 TaxID=3036704 RepID=A0AAU7DMX6_9BACT